MPVGNAAPPRPRRPESVTSWTTAAADSVSARCRPWYPPCATYSSTYGIGFPTNLASLAPAAAATSAAADLIDNVLSTGTKSGYTFALTGAGAVGGVVQAYTASGNPATANTTGIRYFFTNESAVIRQNVGGNATVSSTPIGN